MNPMRNERHEMDGSLSEANQHAQTRANHDALESLPVARRAEGREVSTTKRKPKRRRPRAIEPPQAPAPQKPKSMALAWVLLAFALLWFVNPADFDFIPVAGWLDDLGIGWFAIRNWREAKRQNAPGMTPHRGYDPGPVDDRMRQDEYDRPRQPMLPQQGYAASAMLPPEKPGFFARIMKAISIIFGGDQ